MAVHTVGGELYTCHRNSCMGLKDSIVVSDICFRGLFCCFVVEHALKCITWVDDTGGAGVVA